MTFSIMQIQLTVPLLHVLSMMQEVAQVDLTLGPQKYQSQHLISLQASKYKLDTQDQFVFPARTEQILKSWITGQFPKARTAQQVYLQEYRQMLSLSYLMKIELLL